MLSAIFAVTDGEGRISSRFNRTAAIKDAATKTAVLGFFSPLSFRKLSTFRLSGQLLLGDGDPLKMSEGR